MLTENDRSLTTTEALLLHNMIAALPFDQKIALEAQINSAMVRVLDEFGSLGFNISSEDRCEVKDGPLVTAQQEDRNTVPLLGPYINFLLFITKGKIRELQIYKDDESEITTVYDPEKISVI